jgi:ribosome-associated toxin RatA of RatAB toxin-antitoxin module
VRWLGILTLALVSQRVVAADPRPTAAERRRLDRGEIVTRTWKLPGSDIGTGRAWGVIAAKPERVFAIIADVNRYREFIKRVVDSRVVADAGKSYDFFYKIDMPWPLSDHWFITRNVHRIDEQRRIYRRSWTLVRGSFRRNEGYWQVEPWPGDRSLVTYSVVLQPRSAIPQFVINYVTEKSLPRSIDNLRQRERALRRQKRGR